MGFFLIKRSGDFSRLNCSFQRPRSIFGVDFWRSRSGEILKIKIRPLLFLNKGLSFFLVRFLHPCDNFWFGGCFLSSRFTFSRSAPLNFLITTELFLDQSALFIVFTQVLFIFISFLIFEDFRRLSYFFGPLFNQKSRSSISVITFYLFKNQAHTHTQHLLTHPHLKYSNNRIYISKKGYR